MQWWYVVTHTGGLSVTAPAALAIAAWLAAGHCWRLALHWCVLFAGAMLLVVASKVAFFGWGIGIESIGFTGFSGHAARAAAVFPVACYILLQARSKALLDAGVMAGVLCAALVAISRVVLHAHPVSEAALGFSLGLCVALLFIRRAQNAPRRVLRPWLVGVSLLVLAGSSNAEPAMGQTEPWMVGLALRLSGHPTPYDRRTWAMAPAPRQLRAACISRTIPYACSWPK